MTAVENTIVIILTGDQHSRTPVVLAAATGKDYSAVVRALNRLDAAGTITRSRSRVGAGLLADRPPGEAA